MNPADVVLYFVAGIVLVVRCRTEGVHVFDPEPGVCRPVIGKPLYASTVENVLAARFGFEGDSGAACLR